MAKKQQQQKPENFSTVIAKGTITATSNKSDGKYKQKKTTKTVYFQPATDDDIKTLTDFGLTLYTPDQEENPEAKPYFIIKATDEVRFYTSKEKYTEVPFGVQREKVIAETGEIITEKVPNYQTTEPVYIAVIFVEGGDLGNDFYRLNSIMAKSLEILEEVEAANPFEKLFDGDLNPFD